MKNAAVAGATGLVGSELLKILSAHNQYGEITALNRKEVKYDLPQVTNVVINYDDLQKVDLKGNEVVFCCLGTTMKKAGSKEAFKKVDYEYVVNLARRAVDCGVKTFVVISADGVSADSNFFYMKVKGEMEEAVKKMDFETLLIVRPPLIHGNRDEVRTGEKVAYALLSLFKPFLVGKLRKFAPAHGRQVARACAEFALSKPAGRHSINPLDIQTFSK